MVFYLFILSIVWWMCAKHDPPLLFGSDASADRGDFAAQSNALAGNGRLGRVCIGPQGNDHQVVLLIETVIRD